MKDGLDENECGLDDSEDAWLKSLVSAIGPADGEASRAARARWDAVGKPIGGLGMLEDIVCRMAAIQAGRQLAGHQQVKPRQVGGQRAGAGICDRAGSSDASRIAQAPPHVELPAQAEAPSLAEPPARAEASSQIETSRPVEAVPQSKPTSRVEAVPHVESAPRALAVFCADNGVVAQGEIGRAHV